MSARVTVLSLLVEELNSGRINVVDLTQPLEPDTPVIDLPPMFVPSPPFTLATARLSSRGKVLRKHDCATSLPIWMAQALDSASKPVRHTRACGAWDCPGSAAKATAT